MSNFEFILIGVGLNVGTVRGEICETNVPPCPKGVPSFRGDADGAIDKYAETGYIKLNDGPGHPEVLGGRRFATESDAIAWVGSTEGKRFMAVFVNVFLARVVE